MFIEFSVGNFRSFKEQVALSMVAAKIKARDPKVNENNTIVVDEKLSLLTSAAIYGANASGKSNLIGAFAQMRKLILDSAKDSQVEEPIEYHPFRLSALTEKKPSFFQVIFRLEDGFIYRYGFEVDAQRVHSEWLFQSPSSRARESRLFVREQDDIQIARSFKEAKGLEEKTRPNALFLSVAAQWNGTIAVKVLRWFSILAIISGLDDLAYRNYTTRQFADGRMRDKIIGLVKELDLGVGDIFSEEIDKTQAVFPNYMDNRLIHIKTTHTKWNDEGKPAGSEIFDLGLNESAGTQKLFYLAGPLLDALEGHRILLIDEMEARLHPLITRAIIQKFNALESNPQRAQLIFTTHDTRLLSNKSLRRDQIWFIEKDQQGSSHLYSLAELKKVRNDNSYEDDYIQGRYGAIPYLEQVRKIDLGEG